MKLEDAAKYTEKCFNGQLASCSYACPFHLDIRSFLEKVSKGRWVPAYKELRNAVLFPTVVSVLCSGACGAHCQRVQIGDEPLNLRSIEEACITYAKNRKPDAYFIPQKEQRMAVIGAGIAGLSCALSLARKKYRVTVFDKQPGWGGMLRSHILFPSFFDEDIALQFSVTDVEFRYNTEISSLDEILNDYDAIYVTTGRDGNDYALRGTWDSSLGSTANPKVFMGGALCFSDAMESMARSIEISRIIEGFLQTGRAEHTLGELEGNFCERYLPHKDVARAPMVIPSSFGGYTAENAIDEAARCMQCDCSACMSGCEMLSRFKKKPQKIAVEVYADSQVNPPFSNCSLTREAYSCNNCGYCKSICPEGVDIGSLLNFSRRERMSSGKFPAALHDFWLREMDYSTGEASFVHMPDGNAQSNCAENSNEKSYIFFPGCQLGAFEPDYVLKSYEFLKTQYNAGIFLGCCGAPAYWAGDENRQDTNIERIRNVWEECGKPVFVFACATCQNMLENLLPEIELTSLYELLDSCDSLAVPKADMPDAAVYDPCSARGDNDMSKAVRSIALKAGVSLSELSENNRCCGYGGHMKLANSSLYDEISQNRISMSDKPYITYCANCTEVFRDKGKECTHILDFIFGLCKKTVTPDIDERRSNSVRVKMALMKNEQDKDFVPNKQDWDDLVLVIAPELKREMNKKLISENDLKETIYLAEQSNEKFVDDKDGMCLASLVRQVITYWVQYKKAKPGVYEVYSAYYHRMRFNREV